MAVLEAAREGAEPARGTAAAAGRAGRALACTTVVTMFSRLHAKAYCSAAAPGAAPPTRQCRRCGAGRSLDTPGARRPGRPRRRADQVHARPVRPVRGTARPCRVAGCWPRYPGRSPPARRSPGGGRSGRPVGPRSRPRPSAPCSNSPVQADRHTHGAGCAWMGKTVPSPGNDSDGRRQERHAPARRRRGMERPVGRGAGPRHKQAGGHGMQTLMRATPRGCRAAAAEVAVRRPETAR